MIELLNGWLVVTDSSPEHIPPIRVRLDSIVSVGRDYAFGRDDFCAIQLNTGAHVTAAARPHDVWLRVLEAT